MYSYVKVESCGCHPETCECLDYKVIDDEGKIECYAYDEEEAQILVELFNKE